MKLYKPIQSIKEEIRKPQERIAVIALAAFFIAITAFFMAMGKNNATS